MVVVVEASAFAGAFFMCYNISRKAPVTLRGLVRFLFICAIIYLHQSPCIHYGQIRSDTVVFLFALISDTPSILVGVFILQKTKIFLVKVLTIYHTCITIYIESKRGRQKEVSR